jgi:two-component system chemotaxis response regulator CheB
MLQELRTKIKIAASANVSHWKHREDTTPSRRLAQAKTLAGMERYTHRIKVMAFGASTGGTEALREVLEGFPRGVPGIAIVQHMPPGFTQLFAARLNSLCALEVKEALNDDLVLPGRALVAPGAMQMRVVRSGNVFKVQVRPDQPVNGHCPSVDVLMRSVAQAAGAAAIGVVLTGMGRDGAEGLKAMRDAGAHTLAQNEGTCVVFGMPKAAWDLGGAEKLTPLTQIAPAVLRMLAAKV